MRAYQLCANFKNILGGGALKCAILCRLNQTIGRFPSAAVKSRFVQGPTRMYIVISADAAGGARVIDPDETGKPVAIRRVCAGRARHRGVRATTRGANDVCVMVVACSLATGSHIITAW